MATLVLGGIAQGLGLGQFGAFLFQLGGAYIDSAFVAPALLGNKQGDIQGPRINEFKVTRAVEGTNMNAFVGPRVRTGGAIIWMGPLQEFKSTKKVGGKGGGSSAEQTTFFYKTSLAVAWGEKLTAGGRIRRIWADTKLVYDNGIKDARAADIRNYIGTATQQPDPEIESVEGVGNVPAYRGTCYTVIEDLELGDFGQRAPNFSAEIEYETATRELAPLVTVAGALGSGGNLVRRHDRHLVSGSPSQQWETELSFSVRGDSVPIKQLSNGDFVSIGRADSDDPIDTSGTRSYILDRTTGAETTQNDGTADDWSRQLAIDFNTAYGASKNYVYKIESDASITVQLIESKYRAGTHTKDPVAFRDGRVWKMADDNSTGKGKLIEIDPDTGTATTVISDPDEATSDPFAASEDILFIDNNKFTMLVLHSEKSVTEKDPGSGSANMSAFDVRDGSLKWRQHLVNGGSKEALKAVFTDTHRLFVYADDIVAEIDPTDGSIIQTDSSASATLGSGISGMLIDNRDQLYIGQNISSPVVRVWDANDLAAGHFYEYATTDLKTNASDNLIAFTWDKDDADILPPEINASSAISTLMLRSGYTASDFDVTNVTGNFRGMVVEGPTPHFNPIEQIMMANNITAREEDGKIVFFNRDNVSPETVTEEDLGAKADTAEGADDIFAISDVDDFEIPNEVDVQFVDFDSDYQPGSQKERRPKNLVQGTESAQLGITLTSTEAVRIAKRILWSKWSERQSVAFKLPPSYIHLRAGDLLNVTFQTETYAVRITRSTIGVNYVHEIEGVVEDTRNLTHDTVVAASDAASSTVYEIPDIVFHVLDIPALQSQDLLFPVYYCAAAINNGDQLWRGSTLYESVNDIDFNIVKEQAVESDIGEAQTVLASGPTTYWDRVNTVDVELFEGTLESTAEHLVLQGRNRALIGNEIIAFENATLQSTTNINTKIYRLSKLLRGLRGTPTDGHAEGDRFVRLTPNDIDPIAYSEGIIGVSRFFRSVPAEASLDDFISKSVELTGANLKPLPPVKIAGTRDGSNNLTVTWTRTDKSFKAKLFGVPDTTPMTEDAEEYEIEYRKSTDDSLLRTKTGLTSETASYTASEQTTDGITPGDPVNVRIFQISAIVGRGAAGKKQV